MLPPETAANQSVEISPGRGLWARRLTLLILVSSGSVFRLLFLARKPFWFDETFSVALARMRWGSLLRVLAWREANMSLYYLALRIWLHLAPQSGQSEFFIRSLSVIFAAATLYGVGKTFFWPTILGLTSEQCPRGGALTLNAMGGIGMLAVGILGVPFIGYLQESSATKKLESANPGLYQTVAVEKKYLLGDYHAIDPVKSAAITDDPSKEMIRNATTTGQFSALGKMAIFPAFMLAGYLVLILYFKSKGGYQPVQIVAPMETRVPEPAAQRAG